MKLNERMKVIVGVGVGLVLCLMCYSCGNEETNEQVEPETKQEMQMEEQEELETQEVEEPEIQDESLNKQARNGEYKFETEENNADNLQLAKTFIEETARESMGETRYKVITDEESNTVILIMHIDKNSIAQGIMTSQWDELTENSLILSQKGKETLDLMGLTDVNYAVYIGDIDQDSMYFAGLNGTLIYNAKDTLN